MRLTSADALASRQALNRNPSENPALVCCSATLGDRLLLPEQLGLLEHTAPSRRAALDQRHFPAVASGSRLHHDDDLVTVIEPLPLLSCADGGWTWGTDPILASQGIALVTGE